MSASMVCHEGRLYVLGSFTQIPSTGRLSQVLSVEIFDSEQNGWKEKSVIYQLIALKQVRKRRRIYLKLVLQDSSKE